VAAWKDDRFKWPDGPERNESDKTVVLQNNPLLPPELETEVLAEKTASPLFTVQLHLAGLLERLLRDRAFGPDLAVRMGVAAPHHLSLVLENLHVPDVRTLGEGPILLRPDVDDRENLSDAHLRQRQVVARREADNAADPGFPSGTEEPAIVELFLRNTREEGAEVVVEDERLRVRRIAHSLRPCVSGTEVAAGIILRTPSGRNGFDLPLPGPLGPVRRDEYPFPGQEIESAVRML
jgi:hypothetical protein